MKIIKSTLIIVLLASGSVYAQDTNIDEVQQRRVGALNIQWGFESVEHDHKIPPLVSCKNRTAGCVVFGSAEKNKNHTQGGRTAPPLTPLS